MTREGISPLLLSATAWLATQGWGPTPLKCSCQQYPLSLYIPLSVLFSGLVNPLVVIFNVSASLDGGPGTSAFGLKLSRAPLWFSILKGVFRAKQMWPLRPALSPTKPYMQNLRISCHTNLWPYLSFSLGHLSPRQTMLWISVLESQRNSQRVLYVNCG